MSVLQFRKIEMVQEDKNKEIQHDEQATGTDTSFAEEQRKYEAMRKRTAKMRTAINNSVVIAYGLKKSRGSSGSGGAGSNGSPR